MKMTKEIEEFINLTITEHMGKEYAEWKIKQQSVAEPDKVEEEYEKVIASNIVMQYLTAGQKQRNFLPVGTERWIKITKSDKKHIEIFFIGEE